MAVHEPSAHFIPTPGTMILLWCAGLYLRLTMLLAPPLAPHIAADLGLNQTGIGALTTIPVLMLSLAAVSGAFAIVRLGARKGIALALFIILTGSIARALSPDAAWIYLASAVMGLGIALLQPALPTLLSSWSPGRIGFATAVYMNGMLVGEVLSAGLTLPIVLPLVGGDWRWAIVAWTLPAALVASQFVRRGGPIPAGASRQQGGSWMPNWRDPLVWQLGLLQGASSSLFFGTNAYMASVLAGRGEEALLAPGLLLFNSAQLLSSLLMLRYASRWLGRMLPLVGMLTLSVGSLLLFLVLPGWPALAAAFVISFSTGVLLILLVSLAPALGGATGTVALSAGMFTIAYAVAFLVPLVGGVLADATGRPTLAVLPVLVYAGASLPLAVALGRRAVAVRR